MSQPSATGRTPSDAVGQFRSQFQRAVSCVTRGVLAVRGGYEPATRMHAIAFSDNRLERMAGDRSLGIRINAGYVIREQDGGRGRDRWSIDIVEYRYSIETLAEQEIVAWHFHPRMPHTFARPHLHLGPAAQVERRELHRAHLPTGVVTVADIVRSAIMDFHVEPLRDDWRAILETSVLPIS